MFESSLAIAPSPALPAAGEGAGRFMACLSRSQLNRLQSRGCRPSGQLLALLLGICALCAKSTNGAASSSPAHVIRPIQPIRTVQPFCAGYLA
jgi:hypothetical protein